MVRPDGLELPSLRLSICGSDADGELIGTGDSSFVHSHPATLTSSTDRVLPCYRANACVGGSIRDRSHGPSRASDVWSAQACPAGSYWLRRWWWYVFTCVFVCLRWHSSFYQPINIIERTIIPSTFADGDVRRHDWQPRSLARSPLLPIHPNYIIVITIPTNR